METLIPLSNYVNMIDGKSQYGNPLSIPMDRSKATEIACDK
jgi:hypothetical protein